MYQQERATSRTRLVVLAIMAVMALNYMIRLIPMSLFVSREFCLSLDPGMPPAEALHLCAWSEFMMISLCVVVLTALVIVFVLTRDLIRRLSHGREAGTLTIGLAAAMVLFWACASWMPVGLALGDMDGMTSGTRAQGLPMPVLFGIFQFLQCGSLGYSVLHALEPQKMRRIHEVHRARRYGA